MTDILITVARPYALAAFEYAMEAHDLVSWEAMLTMAAQIVEDKRMRRLLNSPDVTQKELLQLFADVLGKAHLMDAEKHNFIHLLAEYERLQALSEIAALFSMYRERYEKTVTVQMTSAVPLNSPYQQKFTDALTRHLKRKIVLECNVDETLLGGAIIRAGDLVIDGSVRGKLNRLLESL